jgi:uncharacterized protein
MMLIEIDRIPRDGFKIERKFDFQSLELVEENAVFLEPVHADIGVKRMGDEIWIKGRIKTRLSFVCCRCLTPFDFPVDSKFDLVFLPEELHGLKDELDDEDLDQLFYMNHQIDIREVILEQLNLTFPFRPLCTENCEGICAVCGKVRRDAQCSCTVKNPDERLEKLDHLVKDKR